MKYYIDKLNGLWEYDNRGDGGYPWTCLSATPGHEGFCTVGSARSDTSMGTVAPLVAIDGFGKHYEFKEFNTGDKVLVDVEWLDKYGTASLHVDHGASPVTAVAGVIESSPNEEFVNVSIVVRVLRKYVTKL